MLTLFERIGGLPATRALADEFYNVMETDSRSEKILSLHPKNLYMSRLKLYKFLTQWFGGPALFGEQYVNARWLELKHRRFNFTEDEKDQWLYCMDIAMNNLNYAVAEKQEAMLLYQNMLASMQELRDESIKS